MRIRVDGGEIFVDVHGRGLTRRGAGLAEKPVVIALHGGPGLDHCQLVPWLAPLTEDFQIVYLDHRGHGRSSRPPLAECTLDAMADDVETVRRVLGLGAVTVLGVSFGGMVALTYAVRHSAHLARLVLCGTAASGDFVESAWRLAESRATPEQMAEVRNVLRGTFRDDEHMKAGMARLAPLYEHRVDPTGDARAEPVIVNAEVLNWFFAVHVKDYDLRSRLGEIRAPTLVLAGRHDWICAPEHSEVLARGIPGARHQVFDTGHRIIKEANEQFVHAVRAFALAREDEDG